jgi:lysophospholipase L1-like esterase
MNQDEVGQEREQQPSNGKRKDRSSVSRRIIGSASGLAILAALILGCGFGYASYAAFGGTVGTLLGNATGATEGRAGSSNLPSTKSTPNSTSGTTNGTPQGGTNAQASSGPTGNSAESKVGRGETPTNTAGVQGSLAATIAQSKTIHLVALGDSLTHGLGDSSGEGYVGDVTHQARTAGYTVIQSNLGIDGLTSQGLKSEVSQPATISLLQSANLILISIGGNDLNQAAGLPSIQTARIATARAAFETNLRAILQQIRRVNQNAAILVIGLYNPYGDIASAKAQTDAIVETWNADEQTVVSQFSGALVVQTYDLFQFNPTKYLYIDHFHPNQLGYERIAARVWQDLQSIL